MGQQEVYEDQSEDCIKKQHLSTVYIDLGVSEDASKLSSFLALDISAKNFWKHK